VEYLLRSIKFPLQLRTSHNNSSSIEKLQEFRLLDELKFADAQLRRHKLYPAPVAGAGFTIFIYTKLAAFPSRKIPRIIAFLFNSLK
jgi:hypothetical protein